MNQDKGWFCLDATRCFNTLGRLLNHAPPCKATAKPTKPLFVEGKRFFVCLFVSCTRHSTTGLAF